MLGEAIALTEEGEIFSGKVVEKVDQSEKVAFIPFNSKVVQIVVGNRMDINRIVYVRIFEIPCKANIMWTVRYGG